MQPKSQTEKDKLETLAKIEGYESVEEMLLVTGMNGTVPSICMNDTCDYTEEMEPDQSAGWCVKCKDNSMKSCLVLMNLI
jgi:hypothetical protein